MIYVAQKPDNSAKIPVTWHFEEALFFYFDLHESQLFGFILPLFFLINLWSHPTFSDGPRIPGQSSVDPLGGTEFYIKKTAWIEKSLGP